MNARANRKNRIACITLVSVVLLSISACGKSSSNGLMHGARPNNSALFLYAYDSGEARRSVIYDSNTINSVLDELDAVKTKEAKDWTLEDVTLPIYGLAIGAEDSRHIFAAWTNGFWITQDGTVYSFNFDFSRFAQDDAWVYEGMLPLFSIMPCARFLSQDDSGWKSDLLTPAAKLNPPDGVTMAFDTLENDTVTVSIINNSGADWSYGEMFSLQVLLDDVWYDVPAMPGEWNFRLLAHYIPDGEARGKIYNIGMYGNLPTGTYRLVADQLSAEFIVE